MIALVTTYFLVFYILIPGIWFRFITSWFVPLKLFERTRSQEATFAVAVALLPFAFALYGVWSVPGMKQHPFPVNETVSERILDYQRVATLLASSDASRILIGNTAPVPAAVSEAYWRSLNQVLRRQARFLTWYFLFTAGEALLFGFFASKYGDWKIIEGSKTRTKPRPSLWIRVYNWLAPKLILPNISEWYMLLTDFTWPKREEIFVRVDILQGDGNLYQGRVADYFVDSAGKLTGILLEHVIRFERQAYHDAKSQAGADRPVSSNDFWKNIPSQNFYIGQSSIANLNVRFVPKDETLISLAEKILDEQTACTYEVAVTSGDDAGNSHPPDLYT
jgi:hypothetical protein